MTGGSGFIGSAIYQECLKRGQEVVLYDKSEPTYKLPDGVTLYLGDVTDKEKVLEFIRKIQPEHIYHIAGVLGTSELNKTPSKASLSNIVGLANFMDLAAIGELPPIFYATKPNVRENMYTITKECSERILKFYMKNYKVKGNIHRWFNVYGPGQHTHPVRKAVPYFILMALHNLPIHIHGSGNQTCDFIHVKDTANIAVESMNNNSFTQDETIDVGSGQEVVVNDLANLIIELTASKSKIIHDPMREGEIPETKLSANTSRLKHIMGAKFEFIDFKKGMLETIEYYSNLPKEKVDSALSFYSSIV